MPNFPRIPVQSASEGRLSDFQIFEEVDRNQPPALRFLPTGISKFDKALGGGIPSNSVTSWRSPRTFAADAVLLEVCRTACARGERVRLVDASDRFGAAALQAAGLDAFTAQGLFERLHLATISEVAQLADAWRRGETGDAPGLLVVDSLVATVGASFVSQRSGKSKTPLFQNAPLESLRHSSF